MRTEVACVPTLGREEWIALQVPQKRSVGVLTPIDDCNSTKPIPPPSAQIDRISGLALFYWGRFIFFLWFYFFYNQGLIFQVALPL